MTGVLTNLFAHRATVPLLAACTLLLAFLFRIVALILVKQLAEIDRGRKKWRYLIPLVPVNRKALPLKKRGVRESVSKTRSREF